MVYTWYIPGISTKRRPSSNLNLSRQGLQLTGRNEIEIHETWIQYRCVRPGTVDLGYYYVTRKNWKSGYRILVYLKYPDTDYRGSRNAIIRLR